MNIDELPIYSCMNIDELPIYNCMNIEELPIYSCMNIEGNFEKRTKVTLLSRQSSGATKQAIASLSRCVSFCRKVYWYIKHLRKKKNRTKTRIVHVNITFTVYTKYQVVLICGSNNSIRHTSGDPAYLGRSDD